MRNRAPLFNERIYAPYKIAALVEVLCEQGIAPSQSLKGSGVDEDRIYDATALTSVGQYVAVCSNAIALRASPATPFETGARLHLSAYGMYGYALMSCLSMRDYFRLGVKYHALATPTLTIEWSEHDGKAVWTFPDALLFNESREIRRFLIEQQFIQHVTHLQDVFGRSCPPIKACFSYSAPAHAQLYSKYLGCPCIFDHEQCELHYDGAILDQKPHLAHRLTAAVLQQTCERLIGQAKASSGISGEVYQRLLRRPGEFPSMQLIAEQLGMTPRNLRRRLQAENGSFADILDDVRSSLAIEYLRTTKMNTDDIALLLGFSEPTNFRRAFKRWTGKTTSEYRAP
ncbi:AraC family transcriptional regulator [Pollutimonas bauzanensis]|uniref:AraC-type DNA-binding protein n=1 Tax=Pollutimonas bauzanensis TaxID=658167 RepID=A0A1M5SFN9_9BURK|nr:AraC family transcriptional regulator ligand-binding domain-containing protein [Pollutimonas bauzanensis]SHH37417.1 AraC-type DNA-binding protein [Pollutimonas bauzanensis]